MFEEFKKVLDAGASLAFLTAEKAEALGRKLAEEARLSEGEGKKLVDEVMAQARRAREGAEKMAKDAVEAAVKKLDLPTRAEVKALEERLARLEAKNGT